MKLSISLVFDFIQLETQQERQQQQLETTQQQPELETQQQQQQLEREALKNSNMIVGFFCGVPRRLWSEMWDGRIAGKPGGVWRGEAWLRGGVRGVGCQFGL